jgi:F-type H+-transporting ATPase subunit delta
MAQVLSSLAQRYASALSLAFPPGDWERVHRELQELLGLIGNSQVLNLLQNAHLSRERRKEILLELCEGMGLSPETRNFLLLLDRKGRLSLLGEIVQAFSRIIEEKEGIVRGEGEYALEVDPQGISKVESFLERELHKRVKIAWRSNPSLKVGFRVRIGSRVWEGSLIHDLDRWQKLLEKRIAL